MYVNTWFLSSLATRFNSGLWNFGIPFLMWISKIIVLQICIVIYYISSRFLYNFEKQLWKPKKIGRKFFCTKLNRSKKYKNSQKNILPKIGPILSYACLSFRLLFTCLLVSVFLFLSYLILLYLFDCLPAYLTYVLVNFVMHFEQYLLLFKDCFSAGCGCWVYTRKTHLEQSIHLFKDFPKNYWLIGFFFFYWIF